MAQVAGGPSVSGASARIVNTGALGSDAGRLRHVSGKRAEALGKLGLATVRDVFLHVPNRYLDFSRVSKVALADLGQDVTVMGTVDKVTLKRPRPRLPIVELMVTDDTGVMKAVFFRQPWVADQVKVGATVALSGKVTYDYGFRQMKSPFFEVLEDGGDAGFARVLPVHAVSEGLSVAWMRRIEAAALGSRGDVADFVPARLVAARGLPTYARALRSVHFPASLDEAEEARRRLAYDELLCLQVALLARRTMELGEAEPCRHVIDGPHLAALRAALPFALTDEQEVAAAQILADMAAPEAMNRMLLGDVGTGKTAVAALALAAVADTGTQAAMMAPTSVLARQYADKTGPLLDAAGVSWCLVTGSTPAVERAVYAEGVADGSVHVVFGTTAMLSEDMAFRRLTLVVIDEQHRFGVGQRAALREKGKGADLLSMSATPIPRTLALTAYGDMACSRIRKRPRPGAGVSTKTLAPENLDVAYGAIRAAAAAGRQAYVVCPLVDERDDGSALDDVPEGARSGAERLHAATTTERELAERILPDLRVGLLHGRLSDAEKEAVMARFHARELDVLVCTTVVEVGVDVPNATVMLVHDADRFGLATLHQLRGRVGRGDEAGRVYLACAAKRGTPARKRLDALERTSDGFELAELDLSLRHEGEVLGYRQSGGVTLRVTDLAVDEDLIKWAHDDARELVEEDPTLSGATTVPLALESKALFGAYFEETGRA